MTIAVYSGSFDPITNGHLEILKNGSEIFDKVIIAVSYNINKKAFIPLEKRVELIKKCTSEFKNVQVDSYTGLTVDYAKKNNAKFLIRGLRNSADFEYENQMASVNSSLNSAIKTVFFSSSLENNIISSSMVKEIFINNGDISKFVPQCVFEYLNSIKNN